MTTVRPNYIDYAKVLTMFLVIYGHYVPYLGLEMGDNSLWRSVHYINIFHMPLFFLVSGFLFKPVILSEGLKKIYKNLLTPYLLIALITMVIGFLIDWHSLSFRYIASCCLGICSGGDLFGYGILPYQSPLWFCFALMIIQVLMMTINNFKITKMGGVILIILGLLFMHTKINLPCRIDSALVGFIFFYIGFTFKKEIDKISKLPQYITLLLILASIAVVYLTVYFCDDIHNRQVLSINAVYFGKYPLMYIVGALFGCAGCISLCSLLEKYKLRIVHVLSVGMIITLGTQKLLFIILGRFIQPSFSIFMAVGVSIMIYFCCYLLIKVSSKYFPILVGYRKF